MELIQYGIMNSHWLNRYISVHTFLSISLLFMDWVFILRNRSKKRIKINSHILTYEGNPFLFFTKKKDPIFLKKNK